MRKKIAVGLSGGIDSAVSALLLKQKGWDVLGVTLSFSISEHPDLNKINLERAKNICSQLGISHKVIEASDIFTEKIINYFIESYSGGLTPNPCAFCNRFIKFGFLAEKTKSMGINYLATGHYARLAKYKGNYCFRAAKDKNKSQEYFLSLVHPSILNSVVFPLGNYTKDKVRKIAKENRLICCPGKESQDICFIQDCSYKEFIQLYLKKGNLAGNICHVNGKVLGTHSGIYCFTLGQRSGLGISWKEPLYVVDIDPVTKTVRVGEKSYLYKNNFKVKNPNWFIREYQLFKKLLNKLTVKIRYNSLAYPCNVTLEKDTAKVFLRKGVHAITPGQIAVFYYKDIVIGAGEITKQFVRQ
ncbi:MAG: tRNA 2-thiouridine(34) synthase MnmA [Candidatus Omnitrophica bacterium]|nr:tRNA 2-thiouridine(34) synthase MnmA [Candidatus Omnitrophota bacterium]MDD5430192.1 tRNA 2-thiouridine(34) synthase MnmA [Candidatus Omnitrophota bacterium]